MHVVRQQAQNDPESAPVFPGLSGTVLVGCSPPSLWGKQDPGWSPKSQENKPQRRRQDHLGPISGIWCFLPCGRTPMSHSCSLTDYRRVGRGAGLMWLSASGQSGCALPASPRPQKTNIYPAPSSHVLEKNLPPAWTSCSQLC